MNNLQGKRLLLLGSNLWREDLKRFATKNGVYLIFAGLYPGELDHIANEHYRIDTTDSSAMIPFIKGHNIDGIFMGGSELIISKSCDYINQLGYPCYCTKNQWDVLQNKRAFKNCCKKYRVPIVPEYDICDDLNDEDYPVIVKPTDGCASKGINICYNDKELKEAKQKALSSSPTHNIIIERYIDNGGLTNVVNYVAINGNYYLEAMGDRYVLDGGLITAAASFPSLFLNHWLKYVDPMVREMLKGIGLENGVVAFQAIPEGNQIYVYECCFRLTGGMTYKMTDAVSGHNSFRLLLNHVLTGKMCDEKDIQNISPFFNGKRGISITLPLRLGEIGCVEGIEKIKSLKQVVDYTHYYEVGDSIVPQKINTLDQLFARIMVVSQTESDMNETLKTIRKSVSVKDVNGSEMIIWTTFDKLFK